MFFVFIVKKHMRTWDFFFLGSARPNSLF